MGVMGYMDEEPQALGALEKALRDALEVYPAPQVMDIITRMVPRPPASVDPEQFHGRVQKVSVSMPEALTAAIRDRTGPGGFSRFVAEAADKRLRKELLSEYLDELDAVYGPVPHETMEQVRREWPDYEQE